MTFKQFKQISRGIYVNTTPAINRHLPSYRSFPAPPLNSYPLHINDINHTMLQGSKTQRVTKELNMAVDKFHLKAKVTFTNENGKTLW